MLFFTIRRLLQSIVVLLLASFVVYLMVAATSDPLQQLRQMNPRPTQQVLDARAHALGLDQPVLSRYLKWLGNFVTGDFGNSVDGTPVKPTMFNALGVTVRLVLGAIIIAVLLAIVVGVYTAVRKGHLGDYIASFVAYLLIAIPVFWFAALLRNGAIAINGLTGADTIPVVGEETPAISLTESGWPLFQDRFLHLILPTISLAALNYAAWSRYQRATMLDVLGADYIRLARAKGVRWLTVLRRHALRNALIPLTTVVAIGVGALLSGAIITEKVFAWHGLGEFFLTAAGKGDQNQLCAYLVLAAFFVIAFNLIADLLYAVLDPRIRLS